MLRTEEILQELKKEMRHVGFSDSTITIYTELLKAEYLTSQQISQITQLPSDEVQRSLQALLDLNAIAGDAIRKKALFYALDPDLVWPAFQKRVTWNFIHTLVETDIEASIAQLPEGHRSSLKHVRSTVANIGKYAKELFRVSTSIVNHRWRDVSDGDQLSRVLAESIQRSQSTVRAVSKSPRLRHVDLIWQSILAATSRGVKYQRIADITEVCEHGLAVVTRDINEHNIDLRVLDSSEIDQKFYTIDKSLLVVFHQSSIVEDNSNIGRVTNHNEIIKRYTKRFRIYYKDAVPGLIVIQELRKEGERLMQRAEKAGFSSDELDWLQKIINWGRFCLDPDPFVGRITPREHPAVVKGLLQYGTTGHLIPQYGTTVREIKRKQG